MSANEDLMTKWFEEVWNQGREEAVYEMVDENLVLHGLQTAQTSGPEAFLEFYHGFRSQFTDIHIEVRQVVKEGDLQVANCRATAKHIPTGKQVDFTGMTMARVGANGKLVEGWNEFDFARVEKQLATE